MRLSVRSRSSRKIYCSETDRFQAISPRSAPVNPARTENKTCLVPICSEAGSPVHQRSPRASPHLPRLRLGNSSTAILMISSLTMSLSREQLHGALTRAPSQAAIFGRRRKKVNLAASGSCKMVKVAYNQKNKKRPCVRLFIPMKPASWR